MEQHNGKPIDGEKEAKQIKIVGNDLQKREDNYFKIDFSVGFVKSELDN